MNNTALTGWCDAEVVEVSVVVPEHMMKGTVYHLALLKRLLEMVGRDLNMELRQSIANKNRQYKYK